jgi:hypothetical protein
MIFVTRERISMVKKEPSLTEKVVILLKTDSLDEVGRVRYKKQLTRAMLNDARAHRLHAERNLSRALLLERDVTSLLKKTVIPSEDALIEAWNRFNGPPSPVRI